MIVEGLLLSEERLFFIMYTSGLVVISTLYVVLLCGLSVVALPPFEIRSASNRPSEAAEDWLNYLSSKSGKI